jgi:hypothetical protein
MIVALYSNRHTFGLRVWHHQLHIYNITAKVSSISIPENSQPAPNQHGD